jgi:hypothetical protein
MAKSTESDRPRSRLSFFKKLGFSLLATFLALVLLEGLTSATWVVCELVSLFVNSPRVTSLKEDSHCKYDSQLGWSNIPKTRIEDFYGPGRTITINANGVRGLADYSGKPPQTYRMVCLGDSFTLGYGVDDRQTFSYLLEQTQPDHLEVVNMGQGGYSVGQDYLWLKQLSPELDPDLVVCVLIVEDFRRLATTRTANGYATPRFETDGRRLVVSNTPVPQKLPLGDSLVSGRQVFDCIREHSSLADTAGRLFATETRPDDSENLLLGAAILDQIHGLCEGGKCSVALVLTPTISEVFFSESVVKYQNASHFLSEYAREREIPFLDLQPEFERRRDQAEALFLDEQFRHYSEAGHRLVADQLAEWLPQVIEDYPSTLTE